MTRKNISLLWNKPAAEPDSNASGPFRPNIAMNRFRPAVAIPLLLWCGIAAAQEPAKIQKTGPPVGARIPAFELPDQTGRKQTFESLRGPQGLVLLFFRSADW